MSSAALTDTAMTGAAIEARPSNPFASRRVRPGAIPFQFPAGLEAAALVARVRAGGWRGAIVGPHGSGKSTLLAALEPELRRAGRVVIRADLHNGQRSMPPELIGELRRAGPDALAIVDGYEQLGRISRWRLARACAAGGSGLLVTAHERTRLPTLLETSVDLELVRRIVSLLLDADVVAERPGRSSRVPLLACPAVDAANELSTAGQASSGTRQISPLIQDADISRAAAAQAGNLRETLFELYDLYESRRRNS